MSDKDHANGDAKKMPSPTFPPKKQPARVGSWVEPTHVGEGLLGFGTVGFLFGFALQKGRVYEPRVIQDQMFLKDFTMMKMFLSAVATSQIVFVAAEALNVANFRDLRRMYQQDRGSRGLTAVALGAAALGSGFALAGACPGTVYAQMGSEIPGVGAVVLGAAAGTFVFTLMEPWLKESLYPHNVSKDKGLAEMTKSTFTTVALASAAMLTAVTYLFDRYAPASAGYGATSLRGLLASGVWGAITAKAWHPVASGLLIGINQLIAVIWAQQPLGTSSAFVACLSPACSLLPVGKIVDSKTELAQFGFPSKKALMNIILLAGMITGAAVSAHLGNTVGVAAGVSGAGVASAGASASEVALSQAVPFVSSALGPWWQGFLGGFALLWGSRVAKGCTSGHGLSGFALTNVVSWVAVPAMFGGGILTAHLMKLLG